MGIKSEGYTTTMSEPRPFKYWALFAAISRVIQDVPYPDVVNVLDALLEPIQSPGLTTSNGAKSTGRPQGRPRKDTP
jgi:hypothetical protein